jgi:hypothetical protein
MTHTTTLAARVVVTAGPTITAADVRQLLPAAEVVAPIAFGHTYSYRLRAGDTLLIIDGLLLQAPAVRHKELLELIGQGVRVAGCSSMGALRAAELAPFGMLGFGEIFDGYRSGILQADDEVALVHGEAEDGYPVMVDALVNLRATVTAAAGGGLITAEQATRIVNVASGLPFTHRGWQQVLSAAGVPAGQVGALAHQLRRARVDAKRRDAVTALTELRRYSPTAGSGTSTGPMLRERPPATLWTQRWAEQRHRSSHSSVTDAQVVAFLRLFSTDHWTILPALEQFAAWHNDLLGGDPDLPVRDRADSAIATLLPSPTGTAGQDRVNALGRLAHQHMQYRGLITAAGWPHQVLARYLDPDELAAAGVDQVLGSTLLAPRMLHRQPMLPDTRHATDLIRADPRFETWAAHAAEWLAIGDHLAAAHPELDLTRPDPDVLAELFSQLWSTEHLHAELGRRGFASLHAFRAAAAPFAAAAATEPWPGIQVGQL